MNTMPMTADQAAELERLTMHRVKVAEEIRNLETIRKEYDEQIVALAGEGTTTAGPYKVTVTVPRRIDAKAIEAAFPVAQHPELYKRAVDTTAVKNHIAKIDLGQYQTEGSPTVRIS